MMMMREPLLIVGSSIHLPPTPTPPPPPLPQTPKSRYKPSKHLPAKLSCSTPVLYSTTSSLSSSSRSPLLANVLQKLTQGDSEGLQYYADLASKLARDGRFEDFVMIAESVLRLDSDSSSFVHLLDTKLVAAGFAGLIREGRVDSIKEFLSRIQKLGFRTSALFDRISRKSFALECDRLLNDGKLEDFVGLMEVLRGFKVHVGEFVDSFKVIKECVVRKKLNMAVRYTCVLSNPHIFFNFMIQEFGKAGDFQSALLAYEASRCNLKTPNMYICRTIIDVCGLCRKPLKSRYIYEELLAQKIIPNIYVVNSLMNVNAHDLSYILRVYRQMKNLGVVPDITSYNILLKACCLAGRIDLAQNIYKEVRDMASTGALTLDVITYSTIIKVFADAKMWQVALKIKEDMISAGVTPNIVTWSSLIAVCANVGFVDQAIQILKEMILAGCEPNSQCCTTILSACVEACQYDRAFRIFHLWKESGLQKSSHPNEGIATASRKFSIDEEDSRRYDITKSVFSSGPHHLDFVKVVPFRPTTATYNILMKACGTDHYRAKAMMDEMKKVGLSADHISWLTLISIFGRSGDVGGAIQSLKFMRESGIDPDVVAYTTTIKACVENQNFNEAFSLFEEMKRYEIQPNLVTYKTLLRGRSRHGSLREVRQCLAIYQDMRKAGYSSKDYFLKQLIEELCEGVIQDSNRNQGVLTPVGSSNKTEREKSHRLLLEKLAMHLQTDILESLAVDIRGLRKVEARIVVLAVLRMIKESYPLGNAIKHDMVIILGDGKEGEDSNEANVQISVVKLLREELKLDVILPDTKRLAAKHVLKSPLESDLNHKSVRKGIIHVSSARRPVVLRKLVVTKKSLSSWLQKRVPIVGK